MKTIFIRLLCSVTGFLFLSFANAAEPQVTTNNVLTEDLIEKSDAGSVTNDSNKAPANMSEEIPQTDMTGFSRGVVARSIFTTLIDNREPVDKLKQVPEKNNDVFYFTELRDMSGQTAKHRWEYKGKVVAEVKFNVRGPRWRVWSKKTFLPGWSGDWKVSVVNGANEIISEEMIAYTEPAQDIVEKIEIAQGTANESSNKAGINNESLTEPANIERSNDNELN